MPNLHLEIAYYNEEQKNLFQGFPNANALNQIVENGLTITDDEFLAYMMFTWQMDVNGFRTYAELSALVQDNLGAVNQLLSFNNGSIQARVIGNDLMQTGYTERIGVSLGLCLLNKIHNLTAADWKKIPTVPGRNGHPTFDFDLPIASTGNNFIQGENKGSAVTDNSIQNNSIEAHYSSINRKKRYVREQEAQLQIPIHQNLYYGTIGVLDNRPNSNAKIWLVDPPAFEIEMEPRKYKLLARLRYYLDEFRNIGVKKKITDALELRIKEIETSKDYNQFNFKKLDDKFPVKSGYYLYMEGNVLAIVYTSEAFGRIFLVEEEQRIVPYLLAFPKSIMRLIIKQDFESILNYEYNPDFINENIQVLMRFTESEFFEKKLRENLKFVFNKRNKYFEAVYFGKVKHTKDGRIFGKLKNES
ncbi:hypothetical protein [Algoriphagus sp. A40]|uniref:hypothetical protein n=1 Tax=Algoriphagus sp. A40 TaxID=1945863 RepID=UPI000986D2D0|nr:hypothetical protein [Algoriphagus sp. A40]OOG77145.1 hypothetical protein B0E43_05980 [Algoriphagus sp. A40]